MSPTASQTDQVWPLPLTYTTQSNPNWDQQRATHVMTARTDSITKAAGDEWVIFNIKQNGKLIDPYYIFSVINIIINSSFVSTAG